MIDDPALGPARAARVLSDTRRDPLIAVALAALLTLVWAWRDWADLSALYLPDTDDAMRLQQIRDWLAGQAWSDLSQHRLAGGLAMHWTRLADLGPAAIIAVLKPVAGLHAAQVVAVIVWPGLLLFAALILTCRIARVMTAPPATAMLVAALAYPATSLFVPGRIDHHGLQLVLLLLLVAAMLHRRGVASGLGIAIVTALSMVVGLETAPFLLLAMATPVLGWVAGRGGAARQVAALGGGLFVTLIVVRVVFAPIGWTVALCDGFTAPVWRAGMTAAAALVVLAVLSPHIRSGASRAAAAVLAGAAAAGIGWWIAPQCLNPYGAVDPWLARYWLGNVGEAEPLLSASLATGLGQSGLMLAGIAAGVWCLRRTRDPGWAIILLFQLAALAVTFVQLRGAAAGALLAAPALAALIGVAREKGAPAMTGAWLMSAGIAYPLLGGLLPARANPGPPMPGYPCTDPGALARLAALPPGRMLAPIDAGAWLIAATSHRPFAAPYHRNNTGNHALYRFLLLPAAQARVHAAAIGADYLLVCTDGFAELGASPAGSLLAALRRGDPPDWLRPLPGLPGAYRIAQ